MPVTSKTIICRQAAAMVGITTPMQDVDNENTSVAIQCRLFFDQIRDVILESRPWPFATRRWTLQDIGVSGTLYENEWGYRYKIPSDCALPVALVNPFGRRTITLLQDPFSGSILMSQKPPYRLVDQETEYGDALLCDLDDAILEGNFRLTDVNRFNNTANHAVAMGLAAHIATPLRVDAKIAAAAMQQFSDWLAEASTLAMRSEQEDPEQPSEFQAVRG